MIDYWKYYLKDNFLFFWQFAIDSSSIFSRANTIKWRLYQYEINSETFQAIESEGKKFANNKMAGQK